MSVPYLLSDNALFIALDGTNYTIHSTHALWTSIIQALRDGKWDELKTLLSPADTLKGFVDEVGDEGFVFTSNGLTLDGEAVPRNIADKALRMKNEGLPLDAYVRTVRKLRKNPSAAAQREAFDFFVANGMMIAEDGDWIAYKGVGYDYFDKFRHEFDNSVGNTVSMERGNVDDDRRKDCSYGLHVGSYSYASGYAGTEGHLMLVKFDPADIVSVPYDASCQKARVCKYTVIGEMEDHVSLEDKEVYDGDDLDPEYLWVDRSDEEDFDGLVPGEDRDPAYLGAGIWPIPQADGGNELINDTMIEALNEVIRKRQVRSVSAFVAFVEDELGLGFTDEVRGALRQVGFGAWVKKVENLEQ